MLRKISTVTFVLLLTLGISVHAVSAKNELREGENKRIFEKTDRTQPKVLERQETKQELRLATPRDHSDRISQRFGFYGRRLENILNKLESRLEVMNEEGKDVAEALAKVDEAQESLAKAKSLGQQAAEIFANIDSKNYDTQRDKVLEAKELATQARAEFKNTVRLMRESIRLAKIAASQGDT